MGEEAKKTKIKIFVKLFNDIKDRDPEKELSRKQGFVSKYISKTYMPYAIKMAEARRIVERTTNVEANGEQLFATSSPMRWVLYVMSVMLFYTSLEFSNDVMADYDMLDEAGVIEYIFAAIGKDTDTFQTVLNMTYDDYMTNEHDMVSFIQQKFAAIGKLIDGIDFSAIQQAIENANAKE